MAEPNLYHLLGLSSTASQEELTKAYRKLARQFHPDKNPGDEVAKDYMKKLNFAYDLLSDPEKRQAYDDDREIDDDVPNIEGILPGGYCLSDHFKELIETWKVEFEGLDATASPPNARNKFYDATRQKLNELRSDLMPILSNSFTYSCLKCLDKYNQPRQFKTSKELMDHNEKSHGELAEWISTHAGDPIAILCDPKFGLGVINPNSLNNQEQVIALDKFLHALRSPASVQPKAPINDSLMRSFAKVPFKAITQVLQPIATRNIDRSWCRTSFETSKTSDKDPAGVGTLCSLVRDPRELRIFSRTLQAQCTVESKPSERKRDECSTCDKPFRWFRWAHSCRSCGIAMCDDCSETSRLPWYGYNHAVRVCNDCKTGTIPLRIARSWIAISKQVTNTEDSDICLQIASACSSVFQLNLKDDWTAAAQYFVGTACPRLAVYCYKQTNLALLEILPQLINQRQDQVACLLLKSQQLVDEEACHIINKICAGLDMMRIQELVASLNLATSLLQVGDRFLDELNYELAFACYKTNCSNEQIKAHANRQISAQRYTHALAVYLCLKNPLVQDWIELGLQISAAKMADDRHNEFLSMWSSCLEIAFWNQKNIWQVIVENLLVKSQDSRFLAWICLTFRAHVPLNDVLQACEKLLRAEQDISIAALLLLSVKNDEQAFITSCAHRLLLFIRQVTPKEKSLTLADFMRELAHSADLKLANYAIRCLPPLHRAETWRQLARIISDEQAKLQYILLAYDEKPSYEDLVTISSLLKSRKLQSHILCSALQLPDVESSMSAKATVLMHLAVVIGTENPTLQHAVLTLAAELLKPTSLPEPYQQMFIQSKEIFIQFQAAERRKLALFLGRPFYDRNWKMFVDNLVHCFQNGQYKLVEAFMNQTEVQTIEARSMPEKAYLYLAHGVFLAMNDNVHDAVKLIWQAALMFPDEETIFEPAAAILSDAELRTTFVLQMIDSLKNYRTSPSLLFGPLEIPTEHSYQKMLKRTRELVSIAKCETSLKKLNDLPDDDKAFLYIDFSMAAPDMASTLSCFLLSAIWFLKKVQSKEGSLAEQYAHKQAILVCVSQVQSLTQSLSPSLQIYFLQLSSKIVLQVTELLPPVQAVQCATESGLLCGMLRKLVELSRLIPLAIPTQLAGDLPYVGVVSSLVLQSVLNEAAGVEASILPPQRVQYYMFEGVVSGWLQSSKESSDENEKTTNERHQEAVAQARIDCMSEMLIQNNLDWADVERVSVWPTIPRTIDGFLLPTKHDLRDMDIHSIDGFKFDKKSGKLEFKITKATSAKPGLINWSDIRQVMSKGISHAIFSLENPDTAYSIHPFQQVCYSPHSLQDTDFLATLQHTDYLLKFFSTGTEVSGYAPFEMRNSSYLQERLPENLKSATMSIPERKGGMSRGTAHRFWIEAEELPAHEQQTERFLSITYCNPKMVIKKHLLQLDDSGNLVDADVDSMDDSAEAAFAREFTNNYEEIGKYFPEFLRLRELLKLAAMYAHICGVKESQENRFSESVKTEMTNDLETKLHSMKSRIGEWPSASSYSARNARYDQVAANNNLDSLTWNQKSQVDEIMRKEDESVLDELTKNLAKIADLSESSIKPDVRSYLNGYGATQLATRIITAQIQELQKPSIYLNAQLRELGFVNPPANSNEGLHDAPPPCAGSECSWLPAAYNNIDRYRVYGGVCMIPKIREQKSPINNSNSTAVSSSHVAAKPRSTHNWEYQKARNEYLRGLVDCDKTASHIKGWIRNQIRQNGNGYLYAVPGYDTGHRVPLVGGGKNTVDNLRQEFIGDNRPRGPKERKLYKGRQNNNN